MFDKDLIYICKHVDEWPERASYVALDADGGFRFDKINYNFYNECYFLEHINHPEYVAIDGDDLRGEDYSKEQYLACKEYLANPKTSVDGSTSLVVEKIKLRIQEITKRHEQALADELKPLIEVLQRRGEIL